MIKIGFWRFILSILMFFWGLFVSWIVIFLAPLKNLEMLWIIIPIYMNWIFTDIYQEKKRTSLGNAISNGVVITWVGLDWTRHLVKLLQYGEIGFSFDLVIKFFLSALALVFGLFIVIQGIRLKKYIHYLGRIRETSYVMIMFSPIVYGIIGISWRVILAMILFFPLFYYAMELVMKLTPHPHTYAEAEEMEKEGHAEEMPAETHGEEEMALPPGEGI